MASSAEHLEIIKLVEMERASSTDEMIEYCNEKEKVASVPLIANGVNYSEVPQHYIRLPTETDAG